MARLRADGTTKTIYKPIEPSNVLTALLDNQNMDDETRRQWALRLEAMPGVKSIGSVFKRTAHRREQVRAKHDTIHGTTR